MSNNHVYIVNGKKDNNKEEPAITKEKLNNIKEELNPYIAGMDFVKAMLMEYEKYCKEEN